MLSALAAANCHDSLAGGDYEGTSLLYIQGNTSGESPYIDLDDPIVHASLFWNPAGAVDISDISGLIEQPSNGFDVRFPGLLVWNLFDLPEASQLATSSSGAKYGIGVLALYRDYDSDGIFDNGDQLVGVSSGRAVLYAPAPLAASDWPGHVAVPAGYHLISIPLHCNGLPHPPPSSGTDCGISLGASCTGAASCGSGSSDECLVTDPFPWPGGDCVLPVTMGGCAPEGATVYGYRSITTNQATSIWVPACSAASDCTRGQPFQCDFGQGSCLPTDNNQIVAASTVTMPTICAPVQGN